MTAARAAEGGPVAGPDGLLRTPWALGDPLLTRYYDTEWGVPVRTEQGLFERISLEAFQSGLSWLTILRKREAFRSAFADFAVDRVAAFTTEDVDRLLADASIVRNRAKILATIGNAQATRALRDGDGLPALIWSFAPSTPLEPRTVHEVPTRSAGSVALAAALRSHGFRFVGPTTAFALMEAVGMVDTHLVGSHRRGVNTSGA
ncbi:MAG: DNA-3-methyladenine glycosylase I [Mycetocola sp.]